MYDLALELGRATEAAALAVLPHLGRGDKEAIDRAATDALRERLNDLEFAGRIVIGEGKKDGAPGLFAGERVGRGTGEMLPCDLAVDPIDGTGEAARGGVDSLAVLAAGDAGSLFATSAYYMHKVAIGPRLAPRLQALARDWVTLPTNRLIEALAAAARKRPPDLTICLLDRPRHARMLAELRRAGCRVLLRNCDVAASVAVGMPDSEIDACIGISGAPETVLSACALKCLGGAIQAALAEPDAASSHGPVLSMNDLVHGDAVFAATGITAGCLVPGIVHDQEHTITHSLLLSSRDGTIRRLETHHSPPLERMALPAAEDFEKNYRRPLSA